MSCCDRALEGEPDAPAAGSGGQVVDLADDDVEVGMGADSGEAGAHQTAAHDPNRVISLMFAFRSGYG